MSTTLLLPALLLLSTEHLAPVPVHNGETTNGANWGWLHPESRSGGPLEATGAARVVTFESTAPAGREFFAGHVLALDAGAAAIMPLADGSGETIELEPGATYEVSWSQAATAADPPPILAVYLLDQRLSEVEGTRVVCSSATEEVGTWRRQRARFTLPADLTREWGHMLTFQNLARPEKPEDSTVVVDKVALARVEADGAGFRSLFDGRTLEGWTGALEGYRVRDGAIEVDMSSNASGNLSTVETFGDFVLRFEFRLTPGANNGIGIRAPLTGDAAYEGMEIQVLDSGHPQYAGLQPWQYHGAIYGIAPALRGYLRPVGEWNHEEIRVEGRRVRVTLNGQVILDCDLDEATKDGTLSGRPHPGLERTRGHIAFCGHGYEVAFRNLRIRPLDGSPPPPPASPDQNRSSQ